MAPAAAPKLKDHKHLVCRRIPCLVDALLSPESGPPSLVPRVQRHGRLLCSPGSAMKIGMSGKRHACCQVPLHIAWPRLHPASSYAPEAIQNSQPFYERNGSCNQAQAQAAAPLRRYRSQEHAAGGVLCSDLALLLFLFQPQALFLMAT